MTEKDSDMFVDDHDARLLLDPLCGLFGETDGERD